MKHIKMRKEDADKWLKALRSGDYKQGMGYLKSQDNEFCCLGVLEHSLTGAVEMKYSSESLLLPTTDWLKKHKITFFSAKGTECMSFSQTPYLAKLKVSASTANDGDYPKRGYSFKQIADAIEAELDYVE